MLDRRALIKLAAMDSLEKASQVAGYAPDELAALKEKYKHDSDILEVLTSGKGPEVAADRSKLPYRRAAHVFLMDSQGNMLAKRKGKYLALPGGGIDDGETPEEAAVREVLEETGHDIVAPRLVGQAKWRWPVEWADTPKRKIRYQQFQGGDDHFMLARLSPESEADATRTGTSGQLERIPLREALRLVVDSNDSLPGEGLVFKEKQIAALKSVLPRDIVDEIEAEGLPKAASVNNFSKHAKTAARLPSINAERVCSIDGARVMLVDGNAVRERHSQRFLGGSNWRADRGFVPARQYWLERGMAAADAGSFCALLVHECAECSLMRRGLDYDSAHALAELTEAAVRPVGVVWTGAPTAEKLRKAFEAMAARDYGRRADDRARECFGVSLGEWLKRLGASIVD